MSKLIILISTLFFLNNCSFNESSRIWKDNENNIETNTKIKKIFVEDEKIISEFNKELKIELSGIKLNNKIFDNLNNYGPQKYEGKLKKIGNYKFSKLGNSTELNFLPIFLENGIIFFDKKGTIVRFNDKQKIVWKKNHYSKSEKKLRPKLSFLLDGQNLLVTDNISKYYSLKLKDGELNWKKNNLYAFNSEIKIKKGKIFVVDQKNVLRCYFIKDGSECWNLPTEVSFIISNTKYSLIVADNDVVFINSIGEITAVDTESGLIKWQLPTQSSSIINQTYNFKISKIVSDGKSIYFSNNRNEFYSINLKMGTTNWINKINSNITPVLIANLIFTVSNEGYLYVIDKNKGNIIRITDVYKNYKEKERVKVSPVGFAVGNDKLYLTNTDGTMIIVNLNTGNILNEKKVSGSMLSKPFIYKNNLFLIKNGSIIQYN